MQSHSFDNEFRITPEHKLQYVRDGFVKLEGFLVVSPFEIRKP